MSTAATAARRVARDHVLLAFLSLAFALTWGLDLLASALNPPDVVLTLLLTVAGAGPSVAAVVVVAAASGRPGLRRLTARMLHWRVSPGWYIGVLVAFPVVLLGAVAVAVAVDGQVFQSAFPGPAWVLPLYFPLVVLQGPVQEELGWRGLALPTLLQRWGWRRCGVVLGLVWARWHRTPSTWGALAWGDVWGSNGPLGLLLGSVVPDVALSVLMTFVFVRTGGSALLAGLGMHTAANYALYLPAVEANWATTATFAATLGGAALLVSTLASTTPHRRSPSTST